MIALLRLYSRAHFGRHPGKTALAVAGVALGVATFVAIEASRASLAESLGLTIDRLAGDTEIQVTAPGGVDETLLETLRAVGEVAVAEPVVEQVVQPAVRNLGTVLVLGVDLAGDKRLRTYSVREGRTAVPDPLVFLAQPDSAALTYDLAERAGLTTGSSFAVHAGMAERTFRVRALIEPEGFARAYGGNVVVVDVYAAQLAFGRGRMFDRIEIRLAPGVGIDEGLAAVARASGPGYQVTTPARRSAEVERLASGFVASFRTAGFVALGIGVAIIFNVFAVAVERRRRDFGVLRVLGVTPAGLTGLVVAEAAVIGLAGGLLGWALGQAAAGEVARAMAAALGTAKGLATPVDGATTSSPWATALIVGIGASIVGAWRPARLAAHVPPVTAIAAGTYAARPDPLRSWTAPLGIALVGMAYAIGRYGIVGGPYAVPALAVAGALGVAACAGHAARLVLQPLSALMSWLSPLAGRVAADAVLGRPRRTGATTALVVITTAFALGIAGYLGAFRTAFDRWAENVVTADFYVRASQGFGPSAIRLPSAFGETIRAMPGVSAVEGVRYERLPFRGGTIQLVAFDAASLAGRTRHEFVAGTDEAFRVGLPARGEAAVSDNFARRFGVRMGDRLTFDAPGGAATFTVAAVVVNFLSTDGAVMVDRAVFNRHWPADRVDTFQVSLDPGADAAAVAHALRTGLGGDTPALVSSRKEFVEEMDAALESFQVVLRSIVSVALVVGLLAVGTALVVSVADRTRDVALLRALGAGHRDVGLALLWESTALVATGLVLAVPLGELLAWFLRAGASAGLGGFRLPAHHSVGLLAGAVVLVPVAAALVAWGPARWAMRLPVLEGLSDE